VLIVHHLRKSQSERIVWLCEELGIEYRLVCHDRAPNGAAPPDYKAMHPIGIAPIIQDGDVTLAESGAIVEYILAKYGHGKLAVAPDGQAYADYLYWLHFANGTLQPLTGRIMMLHRLALTAENPVAAATFGRFDLVFRFIDEHLAKSTWLAGDAFTAADCMSVFSFTTMRYYAPMDFSPYPNLLAYLARVGERPAYRNAMEKGDPGMKLLLD
jgi:glutathione S-transferase